MANTSAIKNPALDVVEGLVTALIYDVGVNAAIVAATAEMPWLGYPIIRDVFKWIVTSVGTRIFKAVQPYVNITIIKFQNEAQQKAYETALADLKQSQQAGNDEERKKALERAKKALDDLINLGPN